MSSILKMNFLFSEMKIVKDAVFQKFNSFNSLFSFFKELNFFFFFFVFLPFLGLLPAAYGGSQGLSGAVATGLCQSHSSAGSEPRLQSTPQLMATLDP